MLSMLAPTHPFALIDAAMAESGGGMCGIFFGIPPRKPPSADAPAAG